MLFTLLWQSCFRGFNAGAVRLENVLLPGGDSAVPYLVPVLMHEAYCCRLWYAVRRAAWPWQWP